MTFRPADMPPDLWAKTMRGSMERATRNTLRIYCQLVPPEMHRKQLWTVEWFGLFALPWWGGLHLTAALIARFGGNTGGK